MSVSWAPWVHFPLNLEGAKRELTSATCRLTCEACSRHLWIATLSEKLSCFIFYIAVRWLTCPLLIKRGGQRCNCFRGLVKYSSKPWWFELLLQGLRFFQGFWTRSEHALAGDSQPITVRETICLSFLLYFLTHTYTHSSVTYIYFIQIHTHITLTYIYNF